VYGWVFRQENFPLLDKFLMCTVSKMDSQQMDKKEEASEKIPDENIQAVEDSVDDFPKGGGDSVDNLQGEMPEDYSNPMKTVEDLRALRGDQSHPKNMKDGGAKPMNSFSVTTILALIVIVVILVQLFARRKKSKHAEKSV
jgi:hypothetical protein